jgi:ABC-type branched-subunit amino acid transport system ATPase component
LILCGLDFPGFARHLIALKYDSIGDVFTLLNQEHDTKVLLVEQKLAFARRVGKDFYLTEKGQMASGELEQLTDGLFRSTLQFSLIG